MGVRLFKTFPDGRNPSYGGDNRLFVVSGDRRASSGEFTGERTEPGLALVNGIFRVRFRHSAREFLCGFSDCLFEVNGVLLGVMAESTALKNEIKKHLGFCAEGTS